MEMKSFRNYKHIDNWFTAIEKGTVKVCKEQLQLKEYLEKRVFPRDDIYFDEKMVEDSIRIPAVYFPFELIPWEKFIQCFIYGFRWKKDNTLVFNRYLTLMGRGNGKTGYAAWNNFFMLTAKHGIPNYDIDIYANSESQAMTSFVDVQQVIKNRPDLDKKVFDVTNMVIKNKATNSRLKYNTSNARTKDGKRPGANRFDEIHENENYETMNVATSGGGKIKDYREFYDTTNGNVRGGPLDDLIEESEMIFSGELGIDREGANFSSLFPFICKLDNDEEVDTPELWEKACPSINYNDSLKRKMFQEYSQMQRSSQVRMTFMTKRMNRPLEDTRFAVASYEDILHTKQKEMPEKMEEVIGTVDFADVRDFASVGLLGKYSGDVYFKQFTFIHETALKTQNIKREIIDIALEQNKAKIVHGKSIEASYAVNWFLEQAKHYYIKKICMDMYRAKILKPALEEAGFIVEIVRSGSVTHSQLKQLVDNLFIEQKLYFGDDAIMRWYCGNVYEEYIGNGNIRYEKIEPETRKTDGFFSFLHGLNCLDEIYDSQPIKVSNPSGSSLTFQPLVF